MLGFCSLQTSIMILATATSLMAGTDFNLADLPEGKQVTLPPSVEIVGTASQEFQLVATDLPQSLKFSMPPASVTKSLRLAIYEVNQDRPRYVELRQSAPMMYAFRRIGPVRVTAVSTNGSQSSQAKISILSNKPLAVSRRSL